MNSRIVIYQPQYLPRLHYYARILNADTFVIGDYLQYVRKHLYPAHSGEKPHRGPSYQAHTPIKTPQGVLLLDIPVRHTKGDGRQPITEAPIDYSRRWTGKNLFAIEQFYKSAPQFTNVFPSLSALLEKEYASLADLTIATIHWGLSTMLEGEPSASATTHGFRLKEIVPASQSGIAAPEKGAERDANDWLVELCKTYNASEYYFGGTAASAYMDFKKFEDAGITLVEQDWTCTPYAQLHGEFIPNMSIIDLLMNVPPAEAREILTTHEQT